MVTAFNLIYSVSAIRRLLGLAVGVSIRIQKFFYVIWVHVAGRRPTFISKSAFKAHFVEHRKAAAKALTVTKSVFQGHIYSVRNESKGTAYQINIGSGQPICSCDDFNNQIQFLNGLACCKHAYAVLGHLGYGSLREYLAR
ncbi:MAG: hypothetical protein KME42_03685 [Tildeniella nuda ZEHNDER 1965/U140]|jgi:hypothetical protein|nr:hypothetical protein [Tildeniella nuda ZEHNDER 1965/U140]